MPKNNKKKQVKNSNKKMKTTTPAEEKVEVNDAVETETVVKEESIKNAKNDKKATKSVKKADKKENNKNKKHWFKDFKAELKRIIWPSGKELFDNTVVVLVVVIIVSALVFVLDLAFGALNGLEVKQIQKIQNSVTVNSTEDSNVVVSNATEETTSVEMNAVDLTNIESAE